MNEGIIKGRMIFGRGGIGERSSGFDGGGRRKERGGQERDRRDKGHEALALRISRRPECVLVVHGCGMLN